jgi:hypothetical protein
MFQLAAITIGTPSFQWLMVESNMNYVQEIVANIATWILCMG